MSLTVTCQQCGQAFGVAPRLYGARVACPSCGGVLDIPNPQTQASPFAGPPGYQGQIGQPMGPRQATPAQAPATEASGNTAIIVAISCVVGAILFMLLLAMFVSSFLASKGGSATASKPKRKSGASVKERVLRERSSRDQILSRARTGARLPSDGHRVTRRLPARASFDVTFPSGPGWRRIVDGPLTSHPNSHHVAVVNVSVGIQLSVIVFPALGEKQTLDEEKDGWERGFVKKAASTKSLSSITVDGFDAYQAVVEVNAPDGRREVVGILLVAEGYAYTLGVTKMASNATGDRYAKDFIASFRVRRAGVSP